jgi:YVTN family beta-propeller protein
MLGIVMATALLVPGSLVSGSRPASRTAHGWLLVANKGDHALGIIDPEAGREVATVEESGITGHEVIASPDGRTAYVPIYGNSGVGMPGTDGRTLDVIDLASRRLVKTIDLGRPLRPHCPKFGPDGLLYLSTELGDVVTVIDPKTLKMVASLPTGQKESHMLALTRDGKRIYTANVGPGTVSVIGVPARKVLAVIPISHNTQRIALSVDDRWAFTADQTSPRLAVIDTSTNQVKTWVPLAGTGYGTAPTPDGRWLLVAVPNANQVAVIDLESMKVVRNVDVARDPQEVLVRPDDQMAYVSCIGDHKIAAINLSSWKVDKLIEAGKGSDGLAWARSGE